MQPQFITLPHNAKDITNQQFGRLLIVGPIGRDINRHIVWLCKCECGNMCDVSSNQLASRKKQSCGCLRIEIATDRVRTHGLSKHPLYSTWDSMIQRCKFTNHRAYKNYAGRGIEVCQEWQESIQSFIDHVEHLPYASEKGYSLDRIDNSLGYFPGNVRFASPAEQNRNMRSTHLLTYDSKTQCVEDWAKELGIPALTLRSRLRLGWNTEKALMQPIKKRKAKFNQLET